MIITKFTTYRQFNLTVSGTVNKLPVKITCEGDEFGAWYPERLEESYPFAFMGCKTFLNGIESPACKPSNETLSIVLDGEMVPTNNPTLYLGEECSIGEEVWLGLSGFGVGALEGEQKVQSISLQSPAFLPGWPLTHGPEMTATIDNMQWQLATGWKFGIS